MQSGGRWLCLKVHDLLLPNDYARAMGALKSCGDLK
jgi:hypothetical protein